MSSPNSLIASDDQEDLSAIEGTPNQVITPEMIDLIEEALRNGSIAPQNTDDPTHSISFSPRDTQSTLSPNDNCDEISIPVEMYECLVSGEKEGILDTADNLDKYKSEVEKNSVLHIAASVGQGELITHIFPKCKEMMTWQNNKGDLALHSAAKAGHLNALESLMNCEGFRREFLGLRNEDGNTVLHIALENNLKKMAQVLVDKYWEACFQLNDDQTSPLYLCIKLGYWSLVMEMISWITQDKAAAEDTLLGGKSVVHAAIDAKNIDILKEILKNLGSLIESFDDEGRTPLSYAAFKGYLEGVHYLLQKFPESAFKRDKDEEGSFPIHRAASGGNIKVINELYRTKQLLNRKDQNILHVAAASGRSNVVSYLLKIHELEGLINLKDEDGNTPMHLATKGSHPRVVYILTREKRCRRDLQNKSGLTALDVAEIHPWPFPTFESRLTWMALRYVDAPRSSQSTRVKYVQQHRNGNLSKKANDKKELEGYKDRVDTHLLVATLVATVTFAAGFTMPGGYNQSDPHIGMSVLARIWAFEVFVLCNTAALYSSILSIVTLIWAYMGDVNIVLLSLKLALLLLGFALVMMSLAFMMGIFVVLKTVTWLSYVVLGMGSLFLLIVLVFFIPLYNPSYIRSSVVRFFFSGTFLLLLFVCEKSAVD